MAAYCDSETISSALRLPVETVQDILDGKADVSMIGSQAYSHYAPIIQVNSTRTAHRQKVIAFCRAKGGVGTTAMAIHLAGLISESTSTLLIDLNVAEGGSDMAFYLNLPQYPHLGLAKDNLLESIIQVQKDLFVIHPPARLRELNGDLTARDIQDIITKARQEFDAIVIDLPHQDNEATREAIRSANTLVFIVTAFRQEILRVVNLSGSYFNKKQFVVVNNCDMDNNVVLDLLQAKDIISIPYDDKLEAAIEMQSMLPHKSVLVTGMVKLKEMIYKEQLQKGVKGWIKRMVK